MINTIIQQHSTQQFGKGDKFDITFDTKETEMKNYHHAGIQFHRISL